MNKPRHIKNRHINNTKNIGNQALEILETMPLVEGIEYLLSLPKKGRCGNAFSNQHVLAELCTKNTKCACCGVEGTKFMIGKAINGSLHCNLYTDNDIAFSLDHITPKAHGGINHIDNIQLLCIRCNQFKSDKPYKLEVFKKLLYSGLESVQIVSPNCIRVGQWNRMPNNLLVELSQYIEESVKTLYGVQLYFYTFKNNIKLASYYDF